MYYFKILDCFQKQLKPYTKKIPNFTKDLINCLNDFSTDNSISLGSNNYKIRLKVSGLNKGKSKSFRLIIHLLFHKNLIIPIALYLKNEKENISKKEINYYLQQATNELDGL